MRVLGLDPGSRRTGYGVVERSGNRYTCLLHGNAAPKGGLELPQRLHAICERIDAVIAETRPDVVAVEEAFYHESVRSTLVLGHVRGALLVSALRHGCTVAEYSPREIKLSVAGHGGAAKEQVAFMVRRLLGIGGELSPDAADALAGALCHLQRARVTPRARAASAAAQRLAELLASSAPGRRVIARRGRRAVVETVR